MSWSLFVSLESRRRPCRRGWNPGCAGRGEYRIVGVVEVGRKRNMRYGRECIMACHWAGRADRTDTRTRRRQRLAQLSSFLLTLPGVSLPTPPGTEPSLIAEPYLSFVAASASTVRPPLQVVVHASILRGAGSMPACAPLSDMQSKTDADLRVRLQQHPINLTDVYVVGLGEAV